MTKFSEYWKEKALKRRKSWAANAKGFAESHSQLEDIRKKVYLPLDYATSFELKNYISLHFCEHNPFVVWRNGIFGFDEGGLRKAMEAEGADLNMLAIERGYQSIREAEVPQPIINDGPWIAPGKVFDFNNKYHVWLKHVYDICTDKETVKLTYGEISMTLNRYSRKGEPFGFYDLNPCEQLTKAAILMQETDFNFLNMATLLMEIAAEWKLRQEELNYYAKKLKLWKMDASVTSDISFELWDDKKLEKKVAEYIGKDYSVERMIESALRPWQQAITKYFNAITEQEIQNTEEKLCADSLCNNFPYYVENILLPYFNKQGLQKLKIWRPDEKSKDLYMENKGYLAVLKSSNNAFYPNAHYSMCCIYGKLDQAPLRALAYYLQKMPEISKKTDEVVLKVMHFYDQLMHQKNEEYHKNAEFLDSLTTQHQGTPVGKMMKFLRWNLGRFINAKSNGYLNLSIPTIKVLGETSFSFTQKDVPQGLSMVNGQLVSIKKDEIKERWLDVGCKYVYAANPDTTNFDEWVKTHQKGNFWPIWSFSVKDFLERYSPRDSKPTLSIEFINQKF